MAIKTMLFIDGGWMFHNKKQLVEAFENDENDVDYKKFPTLVSNHLKKITNNNIDLVRTNFFGSIPVNKPEFNSSKQKSFYKYLKEDCFFETEVFEIDYQNDPELKPKDKSLNIALTSSVMGNAALDSFDVAAVIISDPGYIPMINRLRMLGKRILLIGLSNSTDVRLQSKQYLFDYPSLYLDEHIDFLKLERNEHYRECMSCGDAELTNWHGAEFYCSGCRENDNRANLRTCDSCGRVEETTWSESYYYCFDCRESHRKTQTSPQSVF
jgi:predicted RNA-binding Zn-ribbon protein involved in translation (DUF1610 family)